MKKFYSVIVNCVIINDNNKVLISKRDLNEGHEGGKWSVPGGKIESTGEAHNVLLVNIKREILEEVGVEVYNSVNLIHDNTFIRSNGDLVLALIFKCIYKAGEARPLEDTMAVKWVTESELDDFEFAPNVREYIRKAFHSLDK